MGKNKSLFCGRKAILLLLFIYFYVIPFALRQLVVVIKKIQAAVIIFVSEYSPLRKNQFSAL
jgi:hypothetical protein